MFVSYTFTNFLIVTRYLLPRVISTFDSYISFQCRGTKSRVFFTNTDISDKTDVNHERKRAYPFNLANLCSKEKETDLSDLSEIIKGVAFYHPFAFAVHRQKFCFE